MSVSILIGSADAVLRTLPDASVHACITSPPYFALRRYLDQSDPLAALEMGSEATPEQYVAHLVAAFREVRRVLHPTGVLVLNLGDSYAGSGKRPTGHNGIGDQVERQGFRPGRKRADPIDGYVTSETDRNRNGMQGVAGYKAKDQMQMPFKVAEALRRDGWYLRSTMPWLKRTAMPESVTDRPSNALEWLFLFSKQARYYWDVESVRQAQSAATLERFGSGRAPRTATAPKSTASDEREVASHARFRMTTAETMIASNGRAFRNTDLFRISLDAAIADARADLARLEAMRATGGVLTDEDGLPLAVDINPQGYAEAHFATYPPALVVPFVKAGTSERGCCPRCLAPWTRVVGHTRAGRVYARGALPSDRRMVGRSQRSGAGSGALSVLSETFGWQPSCACYDERYLADYPVARCARKRMQRTATGDHFRRVRKWPGLSHWPVRPSTVLDCFAGSGTTLLVADRLGRDAVGIELSPAYAAMARARIAADAALPGMAEVAAEEWSSPELFA